MEQKKIISIVVTFLLCLVSILAGIGLSGIWQNISGRTGSYSDTQRTDEYAAVTDSLENISDEISKGIDSLTGEMRTAGTIIEQSMHSVDSIRESAAILTEQSGTVEQSADRIEVGIQRIEHILSEAQAREHPD